MQLKRRNFVANCCIIQMNSGCGILVSNISSLMYNSFFDSALCYKFVGLYASAQESGIADIYESPSVMVSSYTYNPFSGNVSKTMALQSFLAGGISLQQAAKQIQRTPLANITSFL